MILYKDIGSYHTQDEGIMLIDLPDGENYGDMLAHIMIYENGVLTPFLLLKHGYNDGISLLLREKTFRSTQTWGAAGNVYSGSSIDSWLNTTYLQMLPDDIAEIIADTTTETNNAVSVSYDMIIDITRKVFLLSSYEYNMADFEGEPIQYFSNNARRIGLREIDNAAVIQPTRTSFNNSTIRSVSVNGSLNSSVNKAGNVYPRLAFCLPSNTAMIQNDDGTYSIKHSYKPLSITLGKKYLKYRNQELHNCILKLVIRKISHLPQAKPLHYKYMDLIMMISRTEVVKLESLLV